MTRSSKTRKTGRKRKLSQQDPWQANPDLIRKFLEQRPDYEHLCAEVEYILNKLITQANIGFSTITSRAKTLESFLEKIERKFYGEPFGDITDFAGVRVVCLYLNDVPLIESIVYSEFDVIEKVDKVKEKDTDQFGYGAVHYIARLGRQTSGARYDDLKGLLCEIQVRTVMQDAWAIIDHHLVYKKESAIPKPLKRKLNGLAGLFETADDQFQNIRDERAKYLEQVKETTRVPEEFLSMEINLDSLMAYLSWKYPGVPVEAFDNQLQRIHESINSKKYKRLADVDKLVRQYGDSAEKVVEEVKSTIRLVDGEAPSAARLLLIMGLGDHEVAERLAKKESIMKAIQKYGLKHDLSKKS